MLLLNVGHVIHNRQSTLFACLPRIIFMQRQRMKNLLLRARDVDRTSKIKISRRRLTEYVENFHQKACSTIIFPRSTNQSIDLWRCRCRRHFLNSLLFLGLSVVPKSRFKFLFLPTQRGVCLSTFSFPVIKMIFFGRLESILLYNVLICAHKTPNVKYEECKKLQQQRHKS